MVPGTFTCLKCSLVPLDFKEYCIRYTWNCSNVNTKYHLYIVKYWYSLEILKALNKWSYIRGMASFEGDILPVFNYLSASEIWPNKRDGIWWEGPYCIPDSAPLYMVWVTVLKYDFNNNYMLIYSLLVKILCMILMYNFAYMLFDWEDKHMIIICIKYKCFSCNK